MIQVAHKWSNTDGGNRLVSVTVFEGQALVKVTDTHKEQHKQYHLSFKDFAKLVESGNEKHLYDAIRKMGA